MTRFCLLSAPLRAMFALWALLLCLSCIESAVLAAVKKRRICALLAFALLAPAYLLWQVIFDLSLFGVSEKAAALTVRLCSLGWIWWLAAFVPLSFAAAMLFIRNLVIDKTAITPGAIKLYLDKIPCGVCCWRDNGRVLFSNVCMNRLCVLLTGSPLLNGNQFRAAVGEGILAVEDKVWRLSCRELYLGTEPLHEMTASDVTAEYAKTRALKEDKAVLSQLNIELKEYYSVIGDTVRRQEILQAKINIHDEMNRLMLSTAAAAESGDPAEMDTVFSLWEQNALLLCMQADENAGAKAYDDIEKLALALKIRLVRNDRRPETLDRRQNDLFVTAAKEAVVNAVKHAGAKNMYISVAETPDSVCCRFENDGRIPETETRFTGGLANLSLIAEKQGARMTVEKGERFALCISFPKTAAAEGGNERGV